MRRGASIWLKGAIALPIIATALTPLPAHAGTSIGTGYCASEVGSITGVTPSTNGSYCVLKFVTTTNLSTLTTTWTAPPGVSQVRILAVGGGGGGGSDIGGGGGGGQVVDTATVNISYGNTYAIVAGGGGNTGDATWGQTSTSTNTGGVTGSTSSFGGTLVVAKGGSGAVGRSDRQSGKPTASGWDNNGFTGGGGGYNVSGSTGTGGSGFAGGSASGNTNSVGAGGGGAGGAGSGTSNNNGGNGGAGVPSNITGSSPCYGGGGGGASNTGTAGTATCGGHSGGTNASSSGGVADIGYGGGGGGGSGSAAVNGGVGGAGTIIISWLRVQSLSFNTTLSTPFIYRTPESISVSTQGTAGKVTFKIGKARIPGCISMSSNASNSFTVTCNWKPSQRGNSVISVTIIPTGSTYSSTTVTYGPYFISNRSGTR